MPDYRFRTLALPHGVYPKDVTWALEGTAKGTTYRHDAILMVAGGAAPSPFARTFDPVRLPRIQAVERDLTLLAQLLRQESRRALRERRRRRHPHRPGERAATASATSSQNLRGSSNADARRCPRPPVAGPVPMTRPRMLRGAGPGLSPSARLRMNRTNPGDVTGT